jgi:hypothetical protein
MAEAEIILGGYDVYKGNLDAAIRSGAQWPVNEPLSVISAMAAATKSIGFGVTVSTTYEQPYHLARRLSTVDHLTKGRYVVLQELLQLIILTDMTDWDGMYMNQT